MILEDVLHSANIALHQALHLPLHIGKYTPCMYWLAIPVIVKPSLPAGGVKQDYFALFLMFSSRYCGFAMRIRATAPTVKTQYLASHGVSVRPEDIHHKKPDWLANIDANDADIIVKGVAAPKPDQFVMDPLDKIGDGHARGIMFEFTGDRFQPGFEFLF